MRRMFLNRDQFKTTATGVLLLVVLPSCFQRRKVLESRSDRCNRNRVPNVAEFLCCDVKYGLEVCPSEFGDVALWEEVRAERLV
jgi:hypothetical protein